MEALTGLVVCLCAALLDALSCTFDTHPNSKWKFCSCQPLTSDSARVFCRGQPWITVPRLPAPTAPISSLSMVDGALVFLNQDAFNGHNIQMLDLSHNRIQTINVNAFRGLERTLYQLSLNHNNLAKVPSNSLTYLYQLQYLYLQYNRIAYVEGSTFDETQLKKLKYLYLDHNLISYLPANSFSTLQLQVVTLANNRLTVIEKNALPNSLWFLDLKNNALNQIPYDALAPIHNLTTVDLEGNNITVLRGSEEGVKFEKEMTVLLSNNRIARLQPNALDSFRNMKTLDLSYNRIERLPPTLFDSVSRLVEVNLGYNSLRSLNEKTFSNKNVASSLQRLVLEENELPVLPAGLAPLNALEQLNLNSNKLTILNQRLFRRFSKTLTRLLLSYNHLTTIPNLRSMVKLQHLDLSKNRIHNLTLHGTPSLVGLNLAANRISQVTDGRAFVHMSSLAYLDLSHNSIRQVSAKAFSRLTALESLFLQNNKLTQFPRKAISVLSKLRYLVLDDNQILELPSGSLSGLEQLERLSLATNKIVSIDSDSFSHLSIPNLRSLNLAHNVIKKLVPRSFSNLDKLEQLLLHNNRLTEVASRALHNMTDLRLLNMAGNNLSLLEPLALIHLPRLHSLSLAHNRLTAIHKDSLIDVNHIELLDLSHNQFESFDMGFLGEGVPNLKELRLSYNKLATFDLTIAKGSIETLKLAANKFHSINKNALSDFARLRNLDLSQNGILEINDNAFQGCPRLTSLKLTKNYLQFLWKGTFVHQELYSEVDLSENAIESLQSDSFGLDNVHSLDLRSNRLTTVPYNALNSIRMSLAKLNLARNNIKDLKATDFNGLGNLSTLILAHNQIESIEEAAFEGLHKLRRLDLSHNPITTWHPLAFTNIGHSINIMNLAGTGLFSMPRISHRNVRHLNLSGNNIYQLISEDLLPLSKLISLDISNNNIVQLESVLIDLVPNLKKLAVNGNPLRALNVTHFRSLHRLESLRVHDMPNLETIPNPRHFSHLRHLRHFHLFNLPKLHYYNVTRILKHLPALRTLYIEVKDSALNRQLKEADCRMLRDVTVSGQNLTFVHPEAFQYLRGYRLKLALKNTQLSHFPTATFRTLMAVSFLSMDLSHNRLSEIDPFEYTDPPVLNQRGTILERLNLQGNPLTCNCKIMTWHRKWLSYMSTHSNEQHFHLISADWNNTNCGKRQSQYITERCESVAAAACRSTDQKTPILIISYFSILFHYASSSYLHPARVGLAPASRQKHPTFLL